MSGGKHVVIVGGSYAGVTAAKACAAAGLRVTVVEPKDRFDTLFGTIRAMVVADFEDTMWFPYDRVFPAGSSSRFVRGWATGVDTAASVLTYAPAGGGAPVALSFDFLIVACGTRNSCAWFGKTHTRAEYKATLAATREAIAAAPLVLVVGAGMVGVELAGEVKHAHPAKPVVLASSGGVLAHDAHAVPQFIARMTAEVAAAGLDFRAGVRVGGLDALAAREDVVELSPGVFAARGGAGATFPVAVGSATERVGVLIASTGQVPITEWLAGGSLAGALDKRGFVAVGRTYQVAGQRAVFAVGDCAATAGGVSWGNANPRSALGAQSALPPPPPLHTHTHNRPPANRRQRARCAPRRRRTWRRPTSSPSRAARTRAL